MPASCLRCVTCDRVFRGDAESVVAAWRTHESSHGSPVADPAPATGGPLNLTCDRFAAEPYTSEARTLRTPTQCVEGPGVLSESV